MTNFRFKIKCCSLFHVIDDCCSQAPICQKSRPTLCLQKIPSKTTFWHHRYYKMFFYSWWTGHSSSMPLNTHLSWQKVEKTKTVHVTAPNNTDLLPRVAKSLKLHRSLLLCSNSQQISHLGLFLLFLLYAQELESNAVPVVTIYSINTL